jgi:hypothetical protein
MPKSQQPDPAAPPPTEQSRRHAPRRHRLPPGPDAQAAAWQPPGVRKDTPPPEVPAAVRKDKRQAVFDLDTSADAEAAPANTP